MIKSSLVRAAMVVACAGAAFAADPIPCSAVRFDVTGIRSYDALNTSRNVVVFVPMPSGAALTRIGWNVRLTSFFPSWRSEIAVRITDSSGQSGVIIRPGIGDTMSGGPVRYVSDRDGDELGPDLIRLQDLGIPPVAPRSDGLLRLEFFETYDDGTAFTDGQWIDGEIILDPEFLSDPPCLGDSNGSCAVDFEDITETIRNFGRTASQGPLSGDANDDLRVDFADITQIIRSWGEEC